MFSATNNVGDAASPAAYIISFPPESTALQLGYSRVLIPTTVHSLFYAISWTGWVIPRSTSRYIQTSWEVAGTRDGRNYPSYAQPPPVHPSAQTPNYVGFLFKFFGIPSSFSEFTRDTAKFAGWGFGHLAQWGFVVPLDYIGPARSGLMGRRGVWCNCNCRKRVLHLSGIGVEEFLPVQQQWNASKPKKMQVMVHWISKGDCLVIVNK